MIMQRADDLIRRLKLSDLRVLLAVAETRSMGKAAKLLNTVQPAISRSISELERNVAQRCSIAAQVV
jgi:hypothetical protein